MGEVEAGDPAVRVDEQAARLHDLFEIAQTQRVGDLPPDARQHDVSVVGVGKTPHTPVEIAAAFDHASRIARKQRQVRHQSLDRGLIWANQ
jgi:hypothetical protein